MKTLKKTHFVLIGVIMCMLLIGPDVFAASCPLGPDVTKDLYGALKIIRIVAPLLVIAYSTLDTVKALTKGDGGSELKKVAQRFGKRCIYAIILFFLPMLVDLFMQMADVWDANGNCMEEIEKASSTSAGNTTSSTTTTTYNQCAAHNNKEGCDRSPGCNWESRTDSCQMVGINGVTTKSLEEQCRDQGKKWSETQQKCVVDTTCYVCVTSNTYIKINNQTEYNNIVNSGRCQGWALQPETDQSKCS